MKFPREPVLAILIALAIFALLVLFWGGVFLLIAGTFGPTLLALLVRIATDPTEVLIVLAFAWLVWWVWRKRE